MIKIITRTRIIDVHTHAFPDDIAPKVIEPSERGIGWIASILVP